MQHCSYLGCPLQQLISETKVNKSETKVKQKRTKRKKKARIKPKKSLETHFLHSITYMINVLKYYVCTFSKYVHAQEFQHMCILCKTYCSFGFCISSLCNLLLKLLGSQRLIVHLSHSQMVHISHHLLLFLSLHHLNLGFMQKSMKM